MRALLLTLGSYGDVHPFVGLGSRLRKRGHDVTLLTNEHFRGLAESHDLGFEPIGTAEQYQEITSNPQMWHGRRGGIVIVKELANLIRRTHAVLDGLVDDDTVIAASTLGLAARVVHEHRGTPTASVHLAPFVFRSNVDPPRLPGVPPILDWLPAGAIRRFWEGADRYVLDPMVAPAVNDLRAELGLEGKAERIMGDWWHAPQLTLGMWPEWFAPVPVDWPAQVRLCGFPLYDERESHAALSAELSDWLGAGDPPIAFTPGSAMRFGESFFDAAVDACRRLGRRGLLLTRHDEHLPKNLPETVRHERFAPFSLLLPQCAASVHHGGIGTLSQGFAAGLPQVITPMAHDQPDNAARTKRLGAGDWIGPGRLSGRRLAKVLGRVLDDAAVAERCRKMAGRLAEDDGLGRACEALEALARTPASAKAA